MTKKQKKNLIRILAAAGLFILLEGLVLLGVPLDEVWNGYLWKALLLIPYLIVGYDILWKAGKSIRNRQAFDECFLMSVATLGAIALSEMPEAVAVMLFYQIGELFQSIAVGKSLRRISDLMDIRPDHANLETDEGVRQIAPDEVPIGSVIVVYPGEKVPLDGIVEEGEAFINTAALTGESRPAGVRKGSEVLSGSILEDAVLRVRTTKEFGDSTASKILELVENSGMHKSRPEAFITKFARVYTPFVCGGALLLAVIPPLVRGFMMGLSPNISEWIYRALTFLVISCPCALVVSIPLTFFAGIGCGSKSGILVKGSNYLEALSRVTTVVLDKTGTVTEGIFEVNTIHPYAEEDRKQEGTRHEERLLKVAGAAEQHSSHPISKSLQEAARAKGLSFEGMTIREAAVHTGSGVSALVDGKRVFCGNEALMLQEGVRLPDCPHEGTIVHVATRDEGEAEEQEKTSYAGHIVIADRMKEGAAQAIEELKGLGVERLVMLTGDRESAAEPVARALSISELKCSLLPAQKVEAVEAILKDKKEEKKLVAFVGDGMNDAPVLSLADVGIAMGALGSDAAIEAADIVLMDDDIRKLPLGIRIARKCLRIVYENIYLAIGIKAICLILGAVGLANMWLAIFADVGVMVLAVLNALRSMRIGRKKAA